MFGVVFRFFGIFCYSVDPSLRFGMTVCDGFGDVMVADDGYALAFPSLVFVRTMSRHSFRRAMPCANIFQAFSLIFGGVWGTQGGALC